MIWEKQGGCRSCSDIPWGKEGYYSDGRYFAKCNRNCAQQGIWAGLYIYLFFRMLKQNEEREVQYQATIDKLSGNIQSGIENIQSRLENLEEKMSDKFEKSQK